MFNAHGIIGDSATATAARRLVKVRPGVKGFLEGHRYVTADDPPFPVSDYRAAELLKAGLVVAAVPAPGPVERAISPSPARAERATARPARP